MVWPALWDEDGKPGSAVMVPVFKKDRPDAIKDELVKDDGGNGEGEGKSVVGWRMPYDLPLRPYKEDEMPWCAEKPCNEPDWKGQAWPGYTKSH